MHVHERVLFSGGSRVGLWELQPSLISLASGLVKARGLEVALCSFPVFKNN